MMKSNRFVFFIISSILSISSGILFFLCTNQLLSDKEYVNSLKLDSNADSLGIPLAGAAIIAFFIIVFHLFFHLIFFISCFTKIKNKQIILSDLLLKNSRTYLVTNIIRIIGYLISGLLLISYLCSFFKFYLWEFLFYLASLLVIATYILWLATLLEKTNN